ncbi:MAG: hypothetical protein ABIQ24_11610 [Nitrospiraceae bacterium]
MPRLGLELLEVLKARDRHRMQLVQFRDLNRIAELIQEFARIVERERRDQLDPLL